MCGNHIIPDIGAEMLPPRGLNAGIAGNMKHNLDIIKVSDHIIDLGPEGGDRGGEIVATGTPEEVCSVRKSYTGQFLSQFCN
jgi:hypothetical protein